MQCLSIIQKQLAITRADTITCKVVSKWRAPACSPTVNPSAHFPAWIHEAPMRVLNCLIRKTSSNTTRPRQAERRQGENKPKTLVRAGRCSGTACPPLMCRGQVPNGAATIARINCAVRHATIVFGKGDKTKSSCQIEGKHDHPRRIRVISFGTPSAVTTTQNNNLSLHCARVTLRTLNVSIIYESSLHNIWT
jgi:hypothetical protein